MEDAVSDRPATFTEAFARDSAGVDSQSTTPDSSVEPTASASADATVPPAAQEETGVHPSSPEPGPLPFKRHKEILDGAYKERDTYKAQLEGFKDYEWVRQIPAQDFRAVVEKIQRANTDPVGFFRELYTDLANHPTHAQQLRSEAARLLASGRSSEPANLDPDVEITDGQGRVIGRTFSDERMRALMQRTAQETREALLKEFGPLKSDWEQRQTEARQAEQQKALNAQVDAIEADIKEIVGTDEDALKAVAEALRAPENDGLDARRIAIKVFRTHVKDKLAQQAKSEELDSLKKRAAASGLNPGAAVVAQKRRPTSLTDPALWK